MADEAMNPASVVPAADNGDELIMRGVERIESIRTSYEKRIDAQFKTWQFCREMRRDFNLLSVKMFFACRKPEARRLITAMLIDLAEEVEVLANLGRKYPAPAEVKPVTLPLRIISDEAETLCNLMLQADHVLCKLQHSEMAEVAEDQTVSVRVKYKKLKKYVFADYAYARQQAENVQHVDSTR